MASSKRREPVQPPEEAKARKSAPEAWRRATERSRKLGAAIGAFREAQGVTWAELARRLDVSEATVNRLLLGSQCIPLEVVDVVAQALDVPAEQILILGEVLPAELSEQSRADGAFVALVAGMLEVPLTRVSTSIEDAIECDDTLSDAAKRQALTFIAAQRRLGRK